MIDIHDTEKTQNKMGRFDYKNVESLIAGLNWKEKQRTEKKGDFGVK